MMERKLEVDGKQRPLIEEKDLINRKIDEFNGKAQAIRVRLYHSPGVFFLKPWLQNKIEAAALERIQAQNEIDHYEKSLEEAETKSKEADQSATALEIEFQVCL